MQGIFLLVSRLICIKDKEIQKISQQDWFSEKLMPFLNEEKGYNYYVYRIQTYRTSRNNIPVWLRN